MRRLRRAGAAAGSRCCLSRRSGYGRSLRCFPQSRRLLRPNPKRRRLSRWRAPPVTLGGNVIVRIENPINQMDPFQRANLITARLRDLATNPFITPPHLQQFDSAGGTEIRVGDTLVMTVTDADAISAGQERAVLASGIASTMQTAIDETRRVYSVSNRLRALVEVAAVLLTTVLHTWGVGWLFQRLLGMLERLPEKLPAALRRAHVLRSEGWRAAAHAALRITRLAVIVAIWVVAVPQMLRILPSTATIGAQLTGLVLTPLAGLWEWFIVNLANFVTIGLVIGVAVLLIRLSLIFFDEVARETITIRGFEPGWASYTHHLATFLIVIAAAIIAFPYIPGSETALFRGVAVFLGVVLTLSANTAIANVVAGVIQVYTGAFQIGDVVKIGELQGMVAEKRLFTIRVRSFKNEEVSLPNATVLSSSVTNYSAMARGPGLIVYTTVTIGYSVPWQQVHTLLVRAAHGVPELLGEPPPFVLQTSLNDMHVTYQINAYTRHPERLARIYSALHAQIQDQFAADGIEILSPAYLALRSGRESTSPNPGGAETTAQREAQH